MIRDVIKAKMIEARVVPFNSWIDKDIFTIPLRIVVDSENMP